MEKSRRGLRAKIHGLTHFQEDDVILICQKGGTLNAILKLALNSAFDTRSTRRQRRNPLQARKVFVSQVSRGLTNNFRSTSCLHLKNKKKDDPMFHIVDSCTALSASSLVQSREMPHATRAFEPQWRHGYGAAENVSADVEFMNQAFMSTPRYFSIRFEPRPARDTTSLE